MTAGAAQVASVLPDLTRPPSGRGSFIAHTEAGTGAELPLFIKAEPGHKQSIGLFVPGEVSGHWPGAACKASSTPSSRAASWRTAS